MLYSVTCVQVTVNRVVLLFKKITYTKRYPNGWNGKSRTRPHLSERSGIPSLQKQGLSRETKGPPG